MSTATTNEMLRLMAHRRVRSCALAAFGTMVATVFVVGYGIAEPASRFGLFMMGFSVACMLGAAANLLTVVSAARKMDAGLDATREAAVMIANYVNEELHRRGQGYEALVAPGEGIVIRRQEQRPTRH